MGGTLPSGRGRTQSWRGAICLALLVLTGLDGRAEERSGLQAIQGTWRLVGFERGGVPRSADRVPVGWMSFEGGAGGAGAGGRFAASFPDHQMGGTVVVEPEREAGEPAAIDFSHRRGLDQGKSMLAIYRREGERLVLCSAPPGRPGKERPTGFATKGTDNVLFVFERSPFTAAPPGFDAPRMNIARGRIETVEYDSKRAGGKRPLVVYMPPGYTKEGGGGLPVLYLLHGAGQDETVWREEGRVAAILDNLYADRRLVPMIVVMPDATTPRGAPQDDPFRPFVGDLLEEILPAVEAKYAVKGGRENRAIAGLSKGGAQAVWIGLKHRDRFGWVGGFCSALTGDAETTGPIVRDLVGDPAVAARGGQFLWLSCGDEDELLAGNEHFHAALDQLSVPHVWHVDFGGHAWPVWRNDLYLFSQLLFVASVPPAAPLDRSGRGTMD